MTNHVRSGISNGVLTLTLDRPEKKNALTRDMYQALGDGIDQAGQSDEIRCVLIQAEGDMFTAGNDLGDFAAANRGEPDAARAGGNPLLVALARATTPLWPPSTDARSASARRCCCTATWSSCRTTRC